MKLVGPERVAVEARIAAGAYLPGSAVDTILRCAEKGFNLNFELDKVPPEQRIIAEVTRPSIFKDIIIPLEHQNLVAAEAAVEAMPWIHTAGMVK